MSDATIVLLEQGMIRKVNDQENVRLPEEGCSSRALGLPRSSWRRPTNRRGTHQAVRGVWQRGLGDAHETGATREELFKFDSFLTLWYHE